MLLIIKRTIHDMSKNSSKYVKIGSVRLPLNETKNPELIPMGFADINAPPSIIQNIKWMFQKNLLGQDMFLIGVPGFLRSLLLLQYLELTNKEFEYLPITRDTTEADIKQRREIRSGNVFYSDLCAVKAALNGRVLIIDGVEKAERNVLPILNNLLENREMQLDDGRFLMASDRFDKLLEKYTPEQLREWKLERVSENFHVIALGLPTPIFHGHTLDPPLRSRFQCRKIDHLAYDEILHIAKFLAPKIDETRHNKLFSAIYALNLQNEKFSIEGFLKKGFIEMPLYPLDNSLKAVQIWNNNPNYTEEQIFRLCYPFKTILTTDQQSILKNLFSKFFMANSSSSNFEDVEKSTKIEIQENHQQIGLAQISNSNSFRIPIGKNKLAGNSKFVTNLAVENLLTDLITTHSHSDFCLLGPRGSGKSTIIYEFAHRLGYSVETLILYQDMSSRELIQQRRILPNGDTIWEDSQLIRAAKNGHLCILDGLEKVHWSMLESLAPLIHHRFIQLPDGTRLMSTDKYELLKKHTNFTDFELQKRKIFKISENFRLIGLGDSNSALNSSSKWLNEQILSLFIFHSLKPLTIKNELEIIQKLVPNSCPKTAMKLLKFVNVLRDSKDSGIQAVANSLSLRRLIHIMQRHALNPNEGIYDAIHRAVLFKFLPSVIREALEENLLKLNIKLEDNKNNINILLNIDAKNWSQRRMNTNLNSQRIRDEVMIPEILFYDNEQHLKIMDDMYKDFEMGSNLLLIGNQGVGKNKITDRFLQLINRSRQYMQLHRDTTVQSLTVQATVVDGLLKNEDSPLVKAVKEGFVLVIDEADKAPLQVIAILKSLLDSGVLYLSDGRIIQPKNNSNLEHDEKIIPIHKDFRIIMLANRPGFPFLGNDLFGVLGDLFSVHIIENPKRSSEIVMLKKYGPDVPEVILNQLVSIFSDLRNLSDEGILSYPYSTRELVNIIKHIQKFPNDDLVDVIRNVFDFDYYSKDIIEQIFEVFKQHGIELGNVKWQIGSFAEKNGSNGKNGERIEFERNLTDFDPTKLDEPKFGKIDPKNTPHVGGNTWAGGTGGYNTAGLGGIGGPFRLDAGHDVHQMADEAKKQVPEHILKKAREMAKQEYAKKLKEIEMSEYDANAYNQMYNKIEKQVKIFKNIVESLQARDHERQWAKHQTSGELDDTKLIEGIVGEKSIYRRRISQPPESFGSAQLKPKRIRLCFDVSGSMYRFNGYDQRLEKSLETALLVMESLEGSSDKIMYDIYGHSGDSPAIPFVLNKQWPKNEKEKMDILKKMFVHTQYCASGDYTLDSIIWACKDLKKESEQVDEKFVVIISDANLDRYGIRPEHLFKALNIDESINAFLILIGSLGQQAHIIKKSLPIGKAFVANNATEIPQIMQKIFASTIIK